ncbi:MAG: hypothetical protein ACYSW6_11255 [Planctomycetota bacterium]|jgi:hypothetical protein
MAKWTYELLEETIDVIWYGYMEDDYGLEDATEMERSALLIAGWSAEEYDTETISRHNTGCRRVAERGTN